MLNDYLIIGQGIAGTFLSFELQQRGASVVVMDEGKEDTASRVAAGLINPVTGRRLVKTWLADELMSYMWGAYVRLGNSLSVNSINETTVVQFFNAPDMQEAFMRKLNEGGDYLSLPENENFREMFNYPFGVGVIGPCYLANAKNVTIAYRQRLQRRGNIVEEKFDPALLEIHPDGIRYKDIEARKIIFCDGAAGFTNPWFSRLPWSLNKGEALLVHIPGLPPGQVYKFGHTLIPFYPEAEVFWFGSNYEWDFKDDLPTEAFRKKAEAELKHFLKLPFSIVEHHAAIRAANVERRPFVGLHPSFSQIGILNGLGTKGCSLAPFFARQLTEHLMYGYKLMPEADVARFKRTLG